MSDDLVLPGIEINQLLLAKILQGTDLGLQMTGIAPLAIGASKFPTSHHRLSVLIGLIGTYTGTLTLNLSERTTMLFTSALLGEEQSEFTEDCLDAVGEVGNMIAGAFKDGLAGSEFEFGNISCPTIVMGASYDFYFASGFTTVCVNFEVDEVPLIFMKERLFSVSVSMMKR